MNYDEPQEYVYLDSNSIHLIKILTKNRNILKELIMEKDDEIDKLKQKIQDFEDNYTSVPVPSHPREEIKEVQQYAPGTNIELISHLEKAERLVDHYKSMIIHLHEQYNFPDEIIEEFEKDANAILDKSFKESNEFNEYDDNMDTDPNQIMNTSYDEPIPVKDSSLNVSLI